MSTVWTLLKAFIVGGLLCTVGQVLLLKTNFTTARILTIFVVAGVVLTAIGLYEPFAKWAGSGATVPLLGFGYSLAKGAMEAVDKIGLLGAFTGGVTNTAAGITAAIFFGFLNSLIFKPRERK